MEEDFLDSPEADLIVGNYHRGQSHWLTSQELGRYDRSGEKNKLYFSKYIKPIKIDERIQKLKEKIDKYIIIKDDNELTFIHNEDYFGIAQLKVFEKYYKNYIINVENFVNLDGCNLKEIPVQFGYITGRFDCDNNQLTSLKNCPKFVGGDFYCQNNIRQFTEGEVRDLCKVGGLIYR